MVRGAVAAKAPVRKRALKVKANAKTAASPMRRAAIKQSHAGLSAKGDRKSAQSQVNARIDAGLKTAGDAALAAAGLTPTQAVRMLWSLAVRYQDEPEKLLIALDPDSAGPSVDELAERQRKLEAARRGANLMREFFEERGIELQSDPELQNMSERAYFDALREEHFREKGYIA